MPRIGENMERQSERALALARAARAASPEDARKLGEIAANILHQIVAHRRAPGAGRTGTLVKWSLRREDIAG